MAGRGTDILLGGNAEYLAKAALDEQGISEDTPNYDELKTQALENARRITEDEHAKVVEVGGLHVIGTERHESRRIDNQLRGRAARQGDPGSTRFFLSLEDDLMRIFGGEKIKQLMTMLNVPENMAIDNPLISKRIQSAQKRVETYHFDIRKQVLDYDDVINIQRERFYRQRRKVLSSKGLYEDILYMMEREVDRIMRSYISPEQKVEEYVYDDLVTMIKEIHSTFPQLSSFEVKDIQSMRFEPMYNKIKDFVIQAYKDHEIEVVDFYNKVISDYNAGFPTQEPFSDNNIVRQMEKDILLKVVDAKWIDHLTNIRMLQDGIGLRAYGQKDPLIEYKKESYDLFNNMMNDIQSETVKHLFRTRFGVQIVNNQG
jgi:preprotein translocase subunit SecA